MWEEGLITLEICKKNRQPCHAKAITQFEYMNGELISIGKNSLYYNRIVTNNEKDNEKKNLCLKNTIQ